MATSVRTLTWLNLFAFAVHLVSGILGSLLAHQSNPRVSANAPLVAFNTNPAPGEAIFRPIPKRIFSVGAFTGLILFAYITAGFHLVYAVIINSPSWDGFVRRRIVDSSALNPLRWVEYSITATIISAFGQLSIGNDSFYFFLTTLTSGFVLQYFGLLIEKLTYGISKDRAIAGILWNLATIINIVPVGVLLYQLFASKTHNIEIFAYNIFPYFIWFQTFGIVCWLSFMRYRQFAWPEFSEKWYIILSLSTKFTIYWLGFSTFREISVKEGWLSPTPGVNWRTVRFTVSYLPLGLVLFAALRDYYAWAEPALSYDEEEDAYERAEEEEQLLEDTPEEAYSPYGAARMRHVTL